MTQETFTKYDGERDRFESITVSDFVCPHCRQGVRFVVPDQHCELKSLQRELDHYKKLAHSLSKDNYDLKMFCRRLANQ
jgi:hypothetical protein